MPARKPDPAERAGYLDELADVAMSMNPAVLAAIEEHLDPADRRVIERIIAEKKGAGWRRDPLTMGVHFGALAPYPHTALLARKFREAVNGTNPRQLWSLPPRAGKSILASRWGVIWALDQEPDLKVAIGSYGLELARDHAIAVRDALLEYGDELRVRLRPDRRRQDRFVTEQGGGLIASGVGSALTGMGVHLGLVDDPFKNWEEAHSEARRTAVFNWFRSVMRTRLEWRRGIPPALIVIQTRWHESDLIGQLMTQDAAGEGEGWDVVRLPALAENDDPLGRTLGEALAPDLQSKQDLEQARLALGNYLWSGLYQQRPAPEEGGEIKRAWFVFDSQLPPAFDAECTSWDTTWTDTAGSDFTVGQVWGRVGADFWCRDQLRGQWSTPALKIAIALLQVRYPLISRHYVEKTARGPDVMRSLSEGLGRDYEVSDDMRSMLGITEVELPVVTALLRRGMSGLIGVSPVGKKEVRMRRHAGILESLHLHLPAGRDWTLVLVNEAAAFGSTTADHDDCVDAMSQALDKLKNFGDQPPARLRRDVVSPRPSARATRARRR